MDQRTASAERGALVSVCGLLGLSLFKAATGLFTGSKALLADACHSAADCAGSVQAYIGLRSSQKYSGKNRHTELSAAILLTAFVLVAGLEMGISSVRSLASGQPEHHGWGAPAVVAAGMIVREGLLRYKRRLDATLGLRSERVQEHRSDIFASLAALAGTSAAAFGDLLDMPFLSVLDPAAGLVISVFVVRMGYQVGTGTLRKSEHCELDESETHILLETVQRIDGVVAVDDLRRREHGHYIVVEVTIRVNPRITVAEGHEIAQRVRRQLSKRFLHVSDTSVQVQPYGAEYPYKTNHQDQEWTTFLQ